MALLETSLVRMADGTNKGLLELAILDEITVVDSEILPAAPSTILNIENIGAVSTSVIVLVDGTKIFCSNDQLIISLIDTNLYSRIYNSIAHRAVSPGLNFAPSHLTEYGFTINEMRTFGLNPNGIFIVKVDPGQVHVRTAFAISYINDLGLNPGYSITNTNLDDILIVDNVLFYND